ncbi:MAG: gliding motility-associated C-terminal domain-containing protein [Bacteroidota bacterium]
MDHLSKRILFLLVIFSSLLQAYTQSVCDSVQDFYLSDSLAPGSFAIRAGVDISDTVPLYYRWRFSDQHTFTPASRQSWTEHTFPDTGTYNVDLWVMALDTSCQDTLPSKSVTVQDTFYVPNVFSPNGDGVNDFWMVKGDGRTELEVKIFTPGGTMIFERVAPVVVWDGRTMGGKELKPGIYYYFVRPLNTSKPGKEQNGFLYLYK